MVLTARTISVALTLVVVGAVPSPAQRGFGAGSRAGFGARGSDGPRPVLLGFALECVSCRATGRGGRGIAGGGRGSLGVWHYDEYPRVAAVMAGGAAQLAGIRTGDVVMSIDGMSLLSDEGALRLSELRAGDTVHLSLDRGGKSVPVDLVLRRMGGRGMVPDVPANTSDFTTRAAGVQVDVWSDSRVVESTDSTGATILRIGNTVVRLSSGSPSSAGRGRGTGLLGGGRRGGVPPTN
jgi:membrane-associated protease RseP (regulator of RpoE activity)